MPQWTVTFKYNMSDIVKDSLGVNLQVLRILQFSADQGQQTTLDRICTYITYVAIALHVPVLSGLYFLLEENRDSKRLGDDALALAASTCYAFKLMAFMLKRDRIINCIHFLGTVKMGLNEKQQEIIRLSCKVCRRNFNIFLSSILVGLVFWTMKPILLSTHKLPIDIWPPVDTRNRIVFWCVYVYVAIGACYPTIVMAAVDPMVASLACLTSGYLRVLKDNLLFLEEYSDEDVAKTGHTINKSEIMYRRAYDSIILHQKLLYFSNELEESFSQIVFFQFIGSVLAICFCCYHLSMLVPLSMEFLSMLNYLFILLAQVYFYCYYGTELHEESNSVTNAIYMGQWYSYDVRLRKLLLIVMARSKKTITITAGQLVELSLETFATILRRSYSLLAVLKNHQ